MIDFGVLALSLIGMVLLFFLATIYLTTRETLPPRCDYCVFESRNDQAVEMLDNLIDKYDDEDVLNDLYDVHDVLIGETEDDE